MIDDDVIRDCVETLRMMDSNGHGDEQVVEAVISTYTRARRPEWAEVTISEVLAERDQLRETLARVRRERELARRLAIRLEQELAYWCEEEGA